MALIKYRVGSWGFYSDGWCYCLVLSSSHRLRNADALCSELLLPGPQPLLENLATKDRRAGRGLRVVMADCAPEADGVLDKAVSRHTQNRIKAYPSLLLGCPALFDEVRLPQNTFCACTALGFPVVSAR